MKNIISSLFIMLLLAVIGWGVASWWLGVRAELELKTYLAHAEQVPGERLFRFELAGIERHLGGTRALVSVSSDFLLLDEWLNDISLQLEMINGPLFFQNNTIQYGASFWNISLVQSGSQSSATYPSLKSSVSEKKAKEKGVKEQAGQNVEWHESAAGNVAATDDPLASVLIDFSHNAAYAIHYASDDGLVEVKGSYNLQTDDNRGDIRFEGLQLDQPFRISVPKGQISFDLGRNITAGYKPGTSRLVLPEVNVYPPALAPLNFSGVLETAVQADRGGFVDALLKLQVDKLRAKQKGQTHPLESLGLTLRVSQLSAEGLIRLSESHAELDNLQQQVQWALEESSEFPEGQEQIRSLYEQIEIKQKQMPEQIAQQIFSAEKSAIKVDAIVKTTTGESRLAGELGLDEQADLSEHLATLLKGRATLILGEDLRQLLLIILPAEFRTALIKQKSEFELILKNGRFQLH